MHADASSSRSPDLAAIARAFRLSGRYLDGAPHGHGHVNDTYAVAFAGPARPVRFILQRVNARVFPDVPALMRNIERVTAHVANRTARRPSSADRCRTLTLVPTRDGGSCHRDEVGGWWRCYHFIEGGRTHDRAETPELAAAAARAYGEFQRLVADLPGPRLHETIPGFHDTRGRFDSLRRAIAADPCNRAAGAREDIAFALRQEPLVDCLDRLRGGEIRERIVHNDTKLNNVMIDATTREAICVIDLDTVMPGLAVHDFGDLVRSATNAAAEDARDASAVSARPAIFEALVDGYLTATRGFLTPAEVAHLVLAGEVMTYEVGIRFLADHLAGDGYFKIHRPGHNLDRARTQFALLRSLQHQRRAMEAVVQRKVRP